ncbi:hypothetical protein [Amycolatopsis sp. YIM 10]|uniref:hypothetical protein n=1 Tax=Amycolatopsis sp. YIM 10 TaxID=2653857 RepID=UPI001290671B|nr:hypothetical protein [Amycolatopsis sp. YIM 10]QFU93117.1 hypothetical protein YIM_39890 [Amycolatopsis sp. YIM 10]
MKNTVRRLGLTAAAVSAVAGLFVTAPVASAGQAPPVLAPMSPSNWDSTHPNELSCQLAGQRLQFTKPGLTFRCFVMGNPPRWELWVNQPW